MAKIVDELKKEYKETKKSSLLVNVINLRKMDLKNLSFLIQLK